MPPTTWDWWTWASGFWSRPGRRPRDIALNRVLARQYEKRSNFTQAMALWQVIRKVRPDDGEFDRKLKDLAASETIARGQYDEVAAEDKDRPSGEGPVVRPRAAPTPSRSRRNACPAEERVRRESAPLKTRLAADPTNASLYLQPGPGLPAGRPAAAGSQDAGRGPGRHRQRL